MALINKLSDIAEAVRERSGYTGGMTLEEMAIEIKAIPYPVVEEIEITENGTYTPPEGVDGFSSVTVATTGSIEVEPIVLSGDCSHSCRGQIAANYINLFGNSISTKNVTNCSHMFNASTLTKIPFDIIFSTTSAGVLNSMFYRCSKLTDLPIIDSPNVNDIGSMFYSCSKLREIPEDFCDTWDWSKLHANQYSSSSSVFYECQCLRKIPESFLSNMYTSGTSGFSSPYYNTFYYCCSLDKIENLGVGGTYTSNAFSSTFDYCGRIKELTFAVNEDGTPKTAKWKNQTINTKMLGYLGSFRNANAFITLLNHGITADKEVKDDATYQALKNDPDYFTLNKNYSLYNHDAAVRTINSLPDCSATGTNIIHFDKSYGLYTDEGPISNLTEEEIAVAAAKGWTVSLS